MPCCHQHRGRGRRNPRPGLRPSTRDSRLSAESDPRAFSGSLHRKRVPGRENLLTLTFWSLEPQHGPQSPILSKPLTAHLGGGQFERVGVGGRGRRAWGAVCLDPWTELGPGGAQAVGAESGGTEGNSEQVCRSRKSFWNLVMLLEKGGTPRLFQKQP